MESELTLIASSPIAQQALLATETFSFNFGVLCKEDRTCDNCKPIKMIRRIKSEGPLTSCLAAMSRNSDNLGCK